MAKLRTSWIDGRLSEPDEQDTTIQAVLGLEDESKPLLLYITSDASEHARTVSKIDSLVFKDERVQVGTQLFHSVKMPWSRADERLEKLVGKRGLPTFAIFLSDGKRVGALQDRHSPSKLYSLMKRAVKSDFSGTSLDSVVKNLQKILTEIDKIDNARKTLAGAEQKKKLNAAKRKEIERSREKLAQKEQELGQREEKLWKTVYEKSRSAKKTE